MNDHRDMILIVDDDPAVRALLREQVLTQFEIREAGDGPEALAALQQHKPDLILLDLTLPGLSGHDMLVAVRSQGYGGPLIVLAPKAGERPVIEAFRLGATDYVTKPLREAEVAAAVERGLAAVRLRRQRDSLMTRLQESNRQLQARVNELTTLHEIGESVVDLRDLQSLFERILDGALAVTGADHAFLLLRDDKTSDLILRAGRNLRLSLLDRMGEAIHDPLADLVVSTRDAMKVSGKGLRQFTAARDLYAVAYVPLTVQTTAIGVLGVGNHETLTAFDDSHLRLLKSLADYAAIAIVNARLFAMLEQRAQAMEASHREFGERDANRSRQWQVILVQFHQPLAAISAELRRLAEGGEGKLPRPVVHRLDGLRHQTEKLAGLVSSLSRQQD